MYKLLDKKKFDESHDKILLFFRVNEKDAKFCGVTNYIWFKTEENAIQYINDTSFLDPIKLYNFESNEVSYFKICDI